MARRKGGVKAPSVARQALVVRQAGGGWPWQNWRGSQPASLLAAAWPQAWHLWGKRRRGREGGEGEEADGTFSQWRGFADRRGRKKASLTSFLWPGHRHSAGQPSLVMMTGRMKMAMVKSGGQPGMA